MDRRRKYIWGPAHRMATLLVAMLGWTFAPMAVLPVQAGTSDSLTINVKPLDNIPPGAVTDLTATPGGVGQILLQWTAPDNNNGLIIEPQEVRSYTVRIATFSVDSLGGNTTSWWNKAQDVSGEPTPSLPGTTDTMLLNWLSPGVTFYIGMKDDDYVDLVSPVDLKTRTPGQQAHAYVYQSVVPGTPTGFTGTALSTTSVRWSWDAMAYAGFYTLNNYPSGAVVVQTTFTFVTETGLTPNTTYSRTVSAGSASGLSSPSSNQTIYTLADVPINLQFQNVDANQVTMNWNAASNPTGTQYRLERSNDGAAFATVVTQSSTVYTNTGLTDLTTYYYRVRALNGDGLLTAPSAVASTFTVQSILPGTPTGLTGTALSATTVQWSWNTVGGATFYALNVYPSGASVVQTTNTFVIETGLTPNTSYSRTVSAGNPSGFSGPSSTHTLYTLADIPTNLQFQNVSSNQITMNWSAASNPSGTQIRLERSVDGTTFATVVTQSSTVYTNTGLTELTTYYYRVRALNGEGVLTAPSAVISTITLQSGLLGTPTGFTGAALSPTSTQWSWDAVYSAGFYALNVYPSGALVAQTINTSVTETGLTPNTAYSRTVRSGNANGISNPSAVTTIYTLAAAPTNPILSKVSFDQIRLDWNAAGNPSGTQFRLEQSEDGATFVPVVTQSSTGYTTTGLTELSTYYYRVRAFNGDGLFTTPSIVISTVTLKKEDFVSPDVPMGLKGSLDASGNAFTLTWDPVTQNIDGSPCTDLAGYNVYRHATLTGAATKMTATPLAVRAFADVVAGQIIYYTVRAIDTSGNESDDSLIADSSSDANVIFVGPDSLSTLTIPESVNDLLRSANNKYGVPLTVGMSEEPIPSNTEIIRTIKLYLIRGDTKARLLDLAFTKPQSIVAVGYNVINGQVGYGSPALLATKTHVAAVSPNQLSLYWSNGVTWVKVGGTVDQVSQTVKIKSSFLGGYQLRVAAAANALTLDQANVYPRVFTPNDDGFNDRVYFVLQNPNSAVVTGQIFDMAGRLVKELVQQTGTGIGTTLIWDGKDSTGLVVPGGVYVYKVIGEGKTFTGTVAVAR